MITDEVSCIGQKLKRRSPDYSTNNIYSVSPNQGIVDFLGSMTTWSPKLTSLQDLFTFEKVGPCGFKSITYELNPNKEFAGLIYHNDPSVVNNVIEGYYKYQVRNDSLYTDNQGKFWLDTTRLMNNVDTFDYYGNYNGKY